MTAAQRRDVRLAHDAGRPDRVDELLALVLDTLLEHDRAILGGGRIVDRDVVAARRRRLIELRAQLGGDHDAG